MDADTGESVDVLSSHTDTVVTLDFSHTTGLLASGSLDKRILFWAQQSGFPSLKNKDKYSPLMQCVGHEARVLSVSWS